MADLAAPPALGGFQKYDTLWNRTFVGLLIAQFLAAFNDQAIHASAMFFAINKRALPEETAISLMPILFFAPWALFPTFAGYFADRYSKRQALVLWKFAEIGITALALLGFLLGSEMGLPNVGAWIVLSTVFLMGTHSTFFVPAKYGAMPEILRAELLSKGNGLLESLSFLATILGTVSGGVLSFYFYTNEYVIGLILLVLAVVGALASLLIRRMPAANPGRKFPALPQGLYKPLWDSLTSLARSKPLRFALVGIAFFTFMLAFMRAAVYMFGETRVPRWNELKTSAIVGMTALGIGVGSPLAGYLSGKKVELGLVPVGGLGMIAAICVAAFVLDVTWAMVVCIIIIGFFTGFYLVPMFTQLQHRAPKDRKGEMIATSNFVNVLGAIAASLLFFAVVHVAYWTGLSPRLSFTEHLDAVNLAEVAEDKHHRPVSVVFTDKSGARHRVGSADAGGDDDLGLFPPADGGAPSHAPDQILFSQQAQVAWGQYEDDLKAGTKPGPVTVRYSDYWVNGVHYFLFRTPGEPMPDIHDRQHLPRFLFLGAGAMTLGVLLMLWWLLPDLPLRTKWLLTALGRPRLHVGGVRNLPGHGPVVLLTNAADERDRTQVRWASDRHVHFLRDVNWNEAQRLLAEKHVVAVTADEKTLPQVGEYLARLREAGEPGTVVLPVWSGPAVVKFGAPLPAGMAGADALAAIQATAALPEE